MTARDPAQVPDAAAPPNTFSYITIACGILAFVISWLDLRRPRPSRSGSSPGDARERRWKTGLIVALVGMVLGFLSVVLL